jgi:hypothetical protein
MPANRVTFSLFLFVLVAGSGRAAAQPMSFTRVEVPTELSLQSIVAADLNGDGALDLLVTSHSLTENFGIYLLAGHNDGTFAPPARVASPDCGSALNVGDVNGDGVPDILFLSGDFELWALLGDGTGAFPTLVRSAAIGASPRQLLITDLNGDRKADVALSNQNGGVTVALGNGDGSFRPGVTYPITGGFVATGLAAADFNGDGNLDLAATNPGAPDLFLGNTVSVLLGKGDGTFGQPSDMVVSTTPLQIIADDFNRDGRPDLAVANAFGHSVSVLLGLGAGSFLAATNYPVEAPQAIAAADFNVDSNPDLAVCAAGQVIAIFAGQADGSFKARQDIPAAGVCGKVVTGDFNHDGRADMAAIYPGPVGPISVFLNTTTAPDTTTPVLTGTATPSILSPPNGKTVNVTIAGVVSDTGSGVDRSSGTFVVSDEYGIDHPAGNLTIAADGSFSVSIPLVASRRGDDADGRSYTITLSVRDLAGNVGTTVMRVVVPRDQRR